MKLLPAVFLGGVIAMPVQTEAPSAPGRIVSFFDGRTAAAAGPLTPAQAGTWSYASSDRFEVFISGGEREAREAAAAFEGYQAFFERLFKVVPGWRPRTRLVIFAGAKDYELYRPRPTVQAYWLGTPDGDFIVLQAFDEATRIDAVHELAHLVIARTGAVYPLWLDEGLAQYYSTARLSGGQMRLGLELPRAMEALRRSVDAMSVDRLFGVGRELPPNTPPSAETRFYAEAWALVHLLMTHEAYRDRVTALLAAIAGGVPSAEALSATYGKPVAEVAGDLRRYLSRFKVDSVLVDAPTGTAPSITAGAADDVDVAVTLGSVLGWQRGHEQDGRAVLDALEQDAPNRLRLLEARGLLEYYSRHCGPALDYLNRAIDRGSTNPRVLKAAANLAARTDPARSKSLAARAAEAAPMTASGPTIAMAPCVDGSGGPAM